MQTLYAEEASWTDPLTTAKGIESIIANYRSIPVFAQYAKVNVTHATYTADGPFETYLRSFIAY